MLAPDEIFISDYTDVFLDLYRFGNSVSPRLDHIRPMKDAKVLDRSGVKYIIADGNSISAFSSVDSSKRNIWKIPKGTPVPGGIKLVIDKRLDHKGRYTFAPAPTMKLSEFHRLMDEIKEKAIKIS